jgi:hypothetical protein
MSLESATNFKAAIALAAAELTTAWQDTVLTRTAEEIRDSKHALRQIEKLFLFNPATGVVTADDDYIDDAYAGEPVNKGNPFDVKTDINQLALVSATVEDADPTDVVLTFSKAPSSFSGIVLGGEAKVISSITQVGAVVTIVVSVAYANGNAITVDGNFNNDTELGTPVVLDAEVVTNNVA